MVCRGLARDTPPGGIPLFFELDEPTGRDVRGETVWGQVGIGRFGCESRRVWGALGEYSPVDGNGPGRFGGGVAAADAGSGAEEAVERDWVAVAEAVEAGSTRRRVQETSGGGRHD